MLLLGLFLVFAYGWGIFRTGEKMMGFFKPPATVPPAVAPTK
jgi:hypothetical protein